MWATWVDDDRDVHVVEALDVTPMELAEAPSPWHILGDDVCPCQPRVLHEDSVTGRRTFGHKDPVN